jgi:hypothetical protein
MNESQIPTASHEAFDLLRLLGQRRAFAAVAGRCSAAHAQLLRRIHDEKLYLPHAATWEKFCGPNLAVSRRHADRLISLLNRFGPIYFELSQLVGISPREYLALEPAVREHSIVVNGEAVSLIPENAAMLLEAVGQLLHNSRRATRRHLPPSETLRMRLAKITKRCRIAANQLVDLYNSCHHERDRELILEAATELRLILMQPGLE